MNKEKLRAIAVRGLYILAAACMLAFIALKSYPALVVGGVCLIANGIIALVSSRND